MDASDVILRGCYLEGFPLATTPWIDASGGYSGLQIYGCQFNAMVSASASADLWAVRIGGTARGAVLSGLDVRFGGDNGQVTESQVPHVYIDPPATQGGEASEVAILGGNMLDQNPVAQPYNRKLSVYDGSGRACLVGSILQVLQLDPRVTRIASGGSIWRLQLPRATSLEPAQPATTGDMVFDETFGKVQVYNGSEWKSLKCNE